MKLSSYTLPVFVCAIALGALTLEAQQGRQTSPAPQPPPRKAPAAPARTGGAPPRPGAAPSAPLQPVTPIAASDWPNHGRDAGESRFSPLKQIDTTNVSQLQVAWVYDTRVANPPSAAPADAMGEGAGGAQANAGRGRGAAGRAGAAGGAGAPGAGRAGGAGAAAAGGGRNGGAGGAGRGLGRQWEATPIMVDGILYLGTAYNRLVALDPETGKEIWVKDLGHAPATRGISYWPGDGTLPPQIIIGTSDEYLIAVNAKTGEFVPTFGNNGFVDMHNEMVVKVEYASRRVGLSSPPVIYKNVAITGGHSQESPSLGPPADIRAWDLKTGKLLWTFHTIPRPGEFGHETWTGDQWMNRAGGNVWGLMTLDDARGIVYCPVANPATDFYGGDRLGNELFGSTLVALDAMTGKLKWYFQTTHHDNWDYDLTAPPTLIDVKQNGRTIPAVAQFSKQGLLFIFDRVTGKPIFGVEERAVLSDNPVPGDKYSPTQPFPIKPKPLARNTFNLDEVAKVTPEHEAYCKGLLALDGGAMGGGPYAQYGPKPRVIFPGWTGGGNWPGGAFDPSSGYYFINSQDYGMLNKMVPSRGNANMYVRAVPDGAPSSMGRDNFANADKSWPCQAPPWGELIAVNVNTGDIAWRSRLGSYEELDKLGVEPTGTINRGGPIVTAGGVVFIGASIDARFRAFDAKTGKVLWTANISESARTVPMTYQGKNGRQYVVVLAAAGDQAKGRTIDPQQLGGRLYAFALPDAGAQAVPAGRVLDAEHVRPVNEDAVAAAVAAAAGRTGGAARGANGAASGAAGAAPAGGASATVTPEVDAQQRALLERVCADCHSLEQVTSQKQSRARWIETVNEMAGRGAQATDPEFDAIIEYLSRHYGVN